MHMKLSADDLLVVMHLTRERTLENAALALGKDTSSVFRGIKRIEAKVGEPLFTRSRAGFKPLPLGLALCEQAEKIHTGLSAADALLGGEVVGLSGPLRVTTTDLLLQSVIHPHLAAFREAHPNLQLEFNVTNSFENLSERRYDVALRPTSQPPEDMIGMRLGTIDNRLVAAPQYLDQEQELDYQELTWLIPGDSLQAHPATEWFRDKVSSPTSLIRYDSMSLLADGIRSGLGVGILPDIPTLLDGLRDVGEQPAIYQTDLWLLYHPSNRGNPKITAFDGFVRGALAD
ncbi:DNA-binding transcriptional regulator, LysR family [Pseudovibrio ascidiaceicola]|uniref:DNA-binding transcriptional regulator, LysR family n=2 Tax=Pseudovibrio ascidiaceicola TaxID=285279 RepID=A0A1I4EMJ5_9HYPH|nr:DNA-binding transcriptional regulator, LysR family [Pseudovibrio ascidiaceicola]